MTDKRRHLMTKQIQALIIVMICIAAFLVIVLAVR